MITVTKTFFPPQEEYQRYLDRIWKNKWLTNRGELVQELEDELKSYLQVPYILITNNGTIPLQIALRLLGNQGEVITTPFSYVATTSSIIWEHCKPVFVDIHPEYLTIDEAKIEAAITEKTTTILATHVFGNPCNVDLIAQIAEKHQLKVIYDAAHCFGVKYKNKSIFEYGNISTCSFHATKVFHTAEGGALFTDDKELQHQAFYSHNFGHDGPLSFHGLGINAKISELNGAMGLSVLNHIDAIFEKRAEVCKFYDSNLNFDLLQTIKIRENTDWNYSYYPVIFESERKLLEIQAKLNHLGIFPRRYFYPSLNTVPFVSSSKMPVSESIASRILCLPLYADLAPNDLDLIVSSINSSL